MDQVVDPERVARYVDKIDHARGRLGLVAEWAVDAGKSLQARLATYKAFQEAAEAAADLAAMVMVDSGRPAKDDYTNFDALARADVVSPALGPVLREATGLRNRIVHEYEGVDDVRALESMARVAPAIGSFLEEVERWLDASTN